jgi:hypothetical protein
VTAQQIIARIQAQLAGQGIAWREGGRDTFKAGKPETSVRGIATTGMSTFDVLRRAAADGRNLVITHEPTFYNDRDVTTTLESDPVYLAKQRFIAAHDLVSLAIPRSRASDAAGPARRGLGARARLDAIRVAGQSASLRPAPDDARGTGRGGGAAAERSRDPVCRRSRDEGDPRPARTGLRHSGADRRGRRHGRGEISEAGGNAEYALDADAAGQPRGMIVLGHMMSEDSRDAERSRTGCGRSCQACRFAFDPGGRRPFSKLAPRTLSRAPA